MKTFQITLALTLLFNLSGCHSIDPFNQSGFKAVNFGYHAIDPIQFPPLTPPVTRKPGTHDPELAVFTSIGTVTSQGLASTKASFDATVVKGQGNISSLVLYSDNLIFRTIVRRYDVTIDEKGTPKTYTIPVSLIVGVGSRIEGTLNTAAGSLDVSGVPGFNTSVSGNIASARASVYTIGIFSPTIVKMPRFTGELTSASLYTFFQGLSLINASIFEAETNVHPHIMGFYVSALPEPVQPYHITNAIRWEAAKAKTPADYGDASTAIPTTVLLKD